MAVLHQYDYIFALTVIFACLDAWNIGEFFEYLAVLC
jgi:sodium-dependent phosphate transporter